MKSLCLALLGVLSLSVAGARAAPLTLVREGQPAAAIVLATQPTRSAQLAAYELQAHVQAITGAVLPLVTEDQPVTGTRILIGESRQTRALGFKNGDFAPREYAIKYFPDTLLLMGRDADDHTVVKYDVDTDYDSLPPLFSDHATCFAVWDFLEKSCGVRWYRPGPVGLVCPHRATLTVSGPAVLRSPMSRYLQIYYDNPESYDADMGLQPRGSAEREEIDGLLWAELRQKYDPKTTQNYLLAKRREIELYFLRLRTGGEPFAGNHSFYGYYPRFWAKDPQQPDLFEGAHPDWFATGYPGQPPQMSYVSRGFINQVIKDAREYFDTGKKYYGAQAAGNYFALLPMDNDSFSKAAQDQACLNQDQVSNQQFSNGRWSDYVWNFTNEVAREVGRTNPDKYLVQLAYMDWAYPPERTHVEPNVAVQLCLTVRHWWCPSMEANDLKILREWAAQEPRHPLYMFNYYCFPEANAGDSQVWHSFPGFFAHTAARQAQLYKQYGVRGCFYCGIPQDVDQYLVTKFYDDPDQDVDKLLNEYFTSYYGAAAEPMKQMYLKIEQIFSDPKNYPLDVQQEDRTFHQNAEMAWGYLGTAQRMAELQKLMDQAQALAQTDLEKRRVRIFQRDIWDYMVQGRKMYLASLGAISEKSTRALLARHTDPAGDPNRVDWSESTPLYGFRQAQGESTRRPLTAQLAHDGRFLYLQLTEQTRGPLRTDDAITGGDYWELIFAPQRQKDYRVLLVNPAGRLQAREVAAGGAASPWESGAQASSTTANGQWVVRLAVPLQHVVPEGVGPGGHFLMNVLRRSRSGEDQPMWVSTLGDFEDTTHLGDVLVEDGAALAGLDLNTVPTSRVGAGLVGRWEFAEGQGTEVSDASGNGATGKLMNRAGWGLGRHGPAVSLSGGSQYVDFGDQSRFHLQTLTLEVWVKPTRLDGYASLVGRGYAEGSAYSLHIRYYDGSPWFELDDTQGKRNVYNPTEGAVTVGSWNHLVCTYDGQIMRVYLNGRELGPGKPVQMQIAESTAPLQVGILPQNGPLIGLVDEVALYDRALSREEVWQNYLFGKPRG